MGNYVFISVLFIRMTCLVNPLMIEVHSKVSSRSMTLLTITWKLRIILPENLRRAVGNVLINLPPSNDLLFMH